ncbi:MAG: Sec-independent protein translocase subunit TatA [Actinomycetota bacterium]|nr:Sec-independent protein translocase subunit TatA [Actinomycetota bacterium]
MGCGRGRGLVRTSAGCLLRHRQCEREDGRVFDHVPGGWELVLILAVGVALFGSKRLPDSARSIGRSLRIFKAEMKGLQAEEESSSARPEPSSTTTSGYAADGGAARVAPARPPLAAEATEPPKST